MGNTKIEWAEKVWNPVTGCSKISPGCENCYAERMAFRLRGRCGYPADEPFRVTLHPGRLEEPIHWWKPDTIFVCSMGDLFHEDVPFSYIAAVFGIMAKCIPHHRFIVLTKRPGRMKEFFEWLYASAADLTARPFRRGVPYDDDKINLFVMQQAREYGARIDVMRCWPLSNVWLGVTAENQEMADKRIPILLQIPAAVRFVSVEPMLGPINLRKWLFYQMRCTKCKDTGWVTGLERPCLWCNPGGEFRSSVSPAEKFKPKLDWVICGGETGPDARPMHPDWVRSLRDQCQSAGVPFFFKSWGEWVCRPWSSDNGRKRELCLGMDGTSVYAQVGHMMGFRKPGEALMVRVGKKAAGRLLDGRTWEEMPGVRP